MKFDDPRVSVTQTDEYLWRLDRDLVYDDRFVIYAGYETDFASVPRFIWWLVPTYGNYTAATVLHDALITHFLPHGLVTAREVDRIFREAMKGLGVSFVRRWLMWAGVRWGALFNKKRRSGIWLDLPLTFLISALALPFVIPGLIVIPSMMLFSLLDRLT